MLSLKRLTEILEMKTRQKRGASWESVFLRIEKGKHFPLIKLLFSL
jgi:hypothetical protein